MKKLNPQLDPYRAFLQNEINKGIGNAGGVDLTHLANATTETKRRRKWRRRKSGVIDLTKLANAKTEAEMYAAAAELNAEIEGTYKKTKLADATTETEMDVAAKKFNAALDATLDVAALVNAQTDEELNDAINQFYKNTPRKEAAAIGIYGIQNRTLERTDDYFKISLDHAKKSFYFSVMACALGLVLLCFAVVLAIFQRDFKVAIIPAIGATIADFIAATVFWVHHKSAQQLNRYYDSLHEIAIFHSSMDVIELISDEEKKNAAYDKIIDELFNIQKIKAALPAKHDPKPNKEG